MRKAVLMVNLGSPDSTSVKDVRRFLRQFLSDPRVIDLPFPLRQLLLHGIILPFRPRRSAEAYKRIWTTQGSPLIDISHRQMDRLQERLDTPIYLAMRYGNPSIEQAIHELRHHAVQRLLLIPMFPHYAMSSYETAVVEVQRVARELHPGLKIDVMQPYYADSGYINALCASAKPFLDDGFEHLLFSFHGIPERHLHKTDPSHSHCLESHECCHSANPAHTTCYRHQCLTTAERFAERTGLNAQNCSISFQSRLGRDAWLSPYTSEVLRKLGEKKVRSLLVLTPSFVTDCLETLDEIANEGRKIFQEAGGGEMVLIPCLNDHPLFLSFLRNKIRSWQDSLVEA